MSYDPYAVSRGQPQHSYNDSSDYNPYPPANPPHTTYEQPASYQDGGAHSRGNSRGTTGQFEDKNFDPFQPPPKSTGDLRMWRHDHHGNLWMKGGRGSCVARFCCCTTMIVILLFVSIVLTMGTFLRPPDIEFGGIQPAAGASGSAVETTTDDLKVNLGITISVRNPNFFSIAFKTIKANVFYPIGNTEIGGGKQNDVVFLSNAKTSIIFPFTLEYSTAKDPQAQILTDIVSRCGFVPGSAKQQLSLKYTLTLAVQILGITVSPPISGNANFDCPFSLSDIKPLVAGIPALSGILQGTG